MNLECAIVFFYSIDLVHKGNISGCVDFIVSEKFKKEQPVPKGGRHLPVDRRLRMNKVGKGESESSFSMHLSLLPDLDTTNLIMPLLPCLPYLLLSHPESIGILFALSWFKSGT